MKNLLKISLIPLIIFLNNCPKKKSENEKLMQTVNDYTVLQGLVIKNGPSIKFYSTSDATSTDDAVRLDFGYIYVADLTSITKTYYLKNNGDETATISNLKIYSDYSNKIESTNFTFDITEDMQLGPGQFREIKITFTAPKEKKTYNHTINADTNLSSTSSISTALAEVTGYAKVNCKSNQTAIRVENKDSVTKTFHFFRDWTKCEENNTEAVPNSSALYSFGSVASSTVTGYKCVDAQIDSVFLSEGTGSDGCNKYSYSSFNANSSYKVIFDSTLTSNYQVIEE